MKLSEELTTWILSQLYPQQKEMSEYYLDDEQARIESHVLMILKEHDIKKV